MKSILEVLKAIIKNPSDTVLDNDTVVGKVEGLGTLKVSRRFSQNELTGLPTVDIYVTLNNTKVNSYSNYQFSTDELHDFNSRFQSAKRAQEQVANERKKADMALFSEWCENNVN